MNLSTLGGDESLIPLLTALRESSRHRLVSFALAGGLADWLRREFPTAATVDRWESLLVDERVDAVIVAGDSEAVLEAGRRLAAEGKPLLLLPGGDQTAFAYELSLARDDGTARLAPLLPLRADSGAAALLRRAAAGELGRLLQIQFERRLPTDSSHAVSLLPASAMERHLAADADLLRGLGGNYDRVTALQSGVVDGRASSMTVTLAGDSLPDATWTLLAAAPSQLPPASPSSTARGDAAADRDESMRGGTWTLTVGGTEGRAQATSRDGRLDIDRLLDDAAGALGIGDASATASSGAPTWTQLLRACETVDAARRSLKRRRTIDMHFEATSERSQFKTQMTAIGCGVLTLTLLLVMAVMLIGSAFDLPPGIMKVARIAAFAPLFLFLALQALIFVARPSSGSGR